MVLAALLCLFTQPDASGSFSLKRPPLDSQLAANASVVAKCRCGEPTQNVDHQEKGDSEGEPRAAEPLTQEQGALNFEHAARYSNTVCDSDTLLMRGRTQHHQTGIDSKIESGLSKTLMRQRLAYISSYYSAARPSRGNLREVYNFARIHAEDSNCRFEP